MAKRTSWSLAIRNKKLDAIRGDYDNGFLRLYDGDQPDSTDVPVSTQRLLSELRFHPEAFPAAVGGKLTHGLVSDPSAKADGNATWFRTVQSDGTTPLHDGSVGLKDANMVLATMHIVQGAIVEISAFTITEAEVC